ncbi:hypothetical protein EVAR_27032_1 [Eumeta japonica]|uniref:Uncharacterized protein n=1 Tax=Eumeta variegata TaxID=151549 RepID=A0A4C1WEN7_EUMVA|nr:hypothetical protein EVAR_27032_1 [Eumeta japonica]
MRRKKEKGRGELNLPIPSFVDNSEDELMLSTNYTTIDTCALNERGLDTLKTKKKVKRVALEDCRGKAII